MPLGVNITGTPQAGSTLTANPTGATGAVRYEWQAEREAGPIGRRGDRTPFDLVEALNQSFSYGLELLDTSDVFIADISDFLVDGEVEVNNEAKIHGLCRFQLSRRLDWPSVRVRPYMTITDQDTGRSRRYDLGVYLPSAPRRRANEEPQTYDVEGFDKLLVLDVPVTRSLQARAGDRVLATIKSIIAEATGGDTKIRVSGEGDDPVIAGPRLWPVIAFDAGEPVTWLSVINDLLKSIKYENLWVDEQGWFRAQPKLKARDRAPMWVYDVTSPRTTVHPEDREEEFNYSDVPNRWVFIRDDLSQELPSVGNGIALRDNKSNGPTSQDATKRIISRVEYMQALTQDVLEAKADEEMEKDMRGHRYLDLTVGPNPNHSHFDVVRVVDPALDVSSRFVVQNWSLPLSGGGWMNLRLKEV